MAVTALICSGAKLVVNAMPMVLAALGSGESKKTSRPCGRRRLSTMTRRHANRQSPPKPTASSSRLRRSGGSNSSHIATLRRRPVTGGPPLSGALSLYPFGIKESPNGTSLAMYPSVDFTLQAQGYVSKGRSFLSDAPFGRFSNSTPKGTSRRHGACLESSNPGNSRADVISKNKNSRISRVWAFRNAPHSRNSRGRFCWVLCGSSLARSRTLKH